MWELAFIYVAACVGIACLVAAAEAIRDFMGAYRDRSEIPDRETTTTACNPEKEDDAVLPCANAAALCGTAVCVDLPRPARTMPRLPAPALGALHSLAGDRADHL